MKELIKIQTELQAKKNQRNNFGKYNYRSCEDILEALKPHLKSNKCFVLLNDDIIEVAGRVFVKSTVSITNEKGDKVETTALAELPTQQSGMSLSQISGSTSSYSRKYALNGLFAIDDAVHEAVQEVDSTKKQTEKQVSKTLKEELTEVTKDSIYNETKLVVTPLFKNGSEETKKVIKEYMEKIYLCTKVDFCRKLQNELYDKLK